jgi:lipid-A-disaccharide synthase
MEIAVVAGEASGDRHAAELVRALKKEPLLVNAGATGDNLRFWGIGGVELKNEGMQVYRDSRDWGTIGIVESLKNAPGILGALRLMKTKLLAKPPSALILVDFGGLNITLGKWVKDNNICPVLYFMPPGSWRRKPSQGRLVRLVDSCDIVATPFPWSQEQIAAAGGNAHFLGHPLLDLVKSTDDLSEFDKSLGLDPSKTVIALLPGSRVHEVKHILPVMFDAAGLIAQRIQGAQFVVALAKNLDPAMVQKMLTDAQNTGGSASFLRAISNAPTRWRQAARRKINKSASPILATSEGVTVKADPSDNLSKKSPVKCLRPSSAILSAPVAIAHGAAYAAVTRADYAIVASGTATLETAILNRPMTIVYRGSALMELEWHIRKKALDIDFIGLPNILAGRMLCPELIQDQATPEAIAKIAVDMLIQPERLFEAKKELASAVKSCLGEPGASKRAAALFAAEILKGD